MPKIGKPTFVYRYLLAIPNPALVEDLKNLARLKKKPINQIINEILEEYFATFRGDVEIKRKGKEDG
jgi:hypothetical protein